MCNKAVLVRKNDWRQTITEPRNGKTQPVVDSEEILSLSIEELLLRLETSPNGLSQMEADNRIETYGPNELARKKKRAAIIEFLLLFRSPLVIILLFAD